MRAVSLLAIVLAVALAFALPACAKPTLDLYQEIQVGCLMSDSAAPAWGPNLIKAAQIGAEAVNSEGGIDGKPVKLIIEDEGPTQATALYAAHKLVEENGVQVIIGGTTSQAVMSLGPYMENKGILLVSPTATSSELSSYGWSKWVFRIPPGDSLQGGVVAKIIKEQGYKRVAMLVQDTIYGRGIEKTAAEFLRGMADIVASVKYDPAKMSYLSELNEIRDKVPGCVLHAGYYDDGAVIYKQALEGGMDNIPWIAVDGVYDMPLDRYPEAARFMEKVVTGTVPVPDRQSKVYSDFYERYRALYSIEPTIYCDAAFDGVNLIAAAVREAGIYSGAEIRDALIKVGNAYQGASGLITFNAVGERQSGIYGIWKVEMEGTQYKFEITGQPVKFTRSGM
ncbi:MAG: ABC transporter substrate-binding protein [Dehalococcoidia bacterium]|nr:ABC transporter substrate-binding protein [Dehalococcoidia bacterium]